MTLQFAVPDLWEAVLQYLRPANCWLKLKLGGNDLKNYATSMARAHMAANIGFDSAISALEADDGKSTGLRTRGVSHGEFAWLSNFWFAAILFLLMPKLHAEVVLQYDSPQLDTISTNENFAVRSARIRIKLYKKLEAKKNYTFSRVDGFPTELAGIDVTLDQSAGAGKPFELEVPALCIDQCDGYSNRRNSGSYKVSMAVGDDGLPERWDIQVTSLIVVSSGTLDNCDAPNIVKMPEPLWTNWYGPRPKAYLFKACKRGNWHISDEAGQNAQAVIDVAAAAKAGEFSWLRAELPGATSLSDNERKTLKKAGEHSTIPYERLLAAAGGFSMRDMRERSEASFAYLEPWRRDRGLGDFFVAFDQKYKCIREQVDKVKSPAPANYDADQKFADTLSNSRSAMASALNGVIRMDTQSVLRINALWSKIQSSPYLSAYAIASECAGSIMEILRPIMLEERGFAKWDAEAAINLLRIANVTEANAANKLVMKRKEKEYPILKAEFDRRVRKEQRESEEQQLENRRYQAACESSVVVDDDGISHYGIYDTVLGLCSY